ncbi:MAG: hypothetical protein U0640_04035 [Phycisphaerales bacterium]
MSILHRPCPSQVQTTPSTSLKATWRVRSGSIDEPTCKAWLQSQVSPDKPVLLQVAVTEDDATFHLTTTNGEALDLQPLFATLNIHINQIFITRENSGFIHAEVAATRNGEHLSLLRASTVHNSTSDSSRHIRYAVTQLWSLLQVPGGRYELVSE